MTGSRIWTEVPRHEATRYRRTAELWVLAVTGILEWAIIIQSELSWAWPIHTGTSSRQAPSTSTAWQVAQPQCRAGAVLTLCGVLALLKSVNVCSRYPAWVYVSSCCRLESTATASSWLFSAARAAWAEAWDAWATRATTSRICPAWICYDEASRCRVMPPVGCINCETREAHG